MRWGNQDLFNSISRVWKVRPDQMRDCHFSISALQPGLCFPTRHVQRYNLKRFEYLCRGNISDLEGRGIEPDFAQSFLPLVWEFTPCAVSHLP